MLGFNRLSLRRGRTLLFENVTFQVHAGDRLGLVGANGSGKSSMFAMILGQLDPDEGKFARNATDRISHVAQQSPSGRISALDYVIDGDWQLRNVQSAISKAENSDQPEGLERLYEQLELLDGFTADARAARLLHGLGFPEESHSSSVEAFSGGWRMRLNLAQALMCPAEILLLDEPTNHLDLPAIVWLERWLRQFEGILMVASHDRDFLDSVCNRVAHIEHRQIRLYTGNYSEFEQRRSEQLSLQQALHKRQQKEIRHMQAFVDRFRYKASKARQAQSRLKMLERMTQIAPAHVDSPFQFQFMQPDRQPQHLARLEQLNAGYDGAAVLRDVNLLISAGDRIGLLGVNGAGKSTLVKAICDGSTRLSGERVVSRDTHIGYFAQHQLDLLDPGRSPYEHLKALAPADRESELRRFLGSFGFSGERIFEPVAPFSGGEKSRLVLALMIRRKPNLLLLDEPTNHLDLEMRQALSRALVDYSGALLVISHDRHLLRSVCDDLWIVRSGCVERFELSLDDYPAWLQERQQQGGAGPAAGAAPPAGRHSSFEVSRTPNRKQQRRQEAELRQRLQPLRDRVRDIERQLETRRAELNEIDQLMADATLYSDPGRKEEMGRLNQRRTELKTSIDTLEWSWLEASEALEHASARQ